MAPITWSIKQYFNSLPTLNLGLDGFWSGVRKFFSSLLKTMVAAGLAYLLSQLDVMQQSFHGHEMESIALVATVIRAVISGAIQYLNVGPKADTTVQDVIG
jgi:hypothetical protein